MPAAVTQMTKDGLPVWRICIFDITAFEQGKRMDSGGPKPRGTDQGPADLGFIDVAAPTPDAAMQLAVQWGRSGRDMPNIVTAAEV